MKSMIKIAAACLVVSVLTAGVAAATIPSADLKVHRFADEGVSAQGYRNLTPGCCSSLNKSRSQELVN